MVDEAKVVEALGCDPSEFSGFESHHPPLTRRRQFESDWDKLASRVNSRSLKTNAYGVADSTPGV